MDLSLIAPKVLIGELEAASRGEDEVMSLGKLRFQRVWLEGILVSEMDQGTLVLDDGSAVIDLYLTEKHQAQSWKPGMYVLVQGRYSEDSVPFIEVHRILNLFSNPAREALWYLEVAEVHEVFYSALLSNRKRKKSESANVTDRTVIEV